jgi:thymidylate synthase (FAD)
MEKQDLTKPIKVGSAGFVRLVDSMGDDSSVVQAARVSYGAGTKATSEDEALIRYLMRHKHTTPFEMVTLKFHVKVPMDIWRQWVRHRTASINEYSTRYSIAIDEAAVASSWRMQSKDNKQGSSGVLESGKLLNGKLKFEAYLVLEKMIHENTDEEILAWIQSSNIYDSSVTIEDIMKDYSAAVLSFKEVELQNMSRDVYETRLSIGIAREQARKDLPLSTYTEAYWQVNLHNLFHFLALRLHPHAQQEIREFAQAIFSIVREIVPISTKAFNDYVLDARTFLVKKCLV